MTMKKNKVLMGLLSMLLMAGILFTACPMNDDDGGDDSSDDDNGLSVSGPGDLPGLPDGIIAITEDEVEALLGKLDFLGAVFKDVNKVVDAASEAGDDPYKVTDDTSVEGLKINATGRDSDEGLYQKITVDFIADGTEPEVIIYKDSQIKLERSVSATGGGEGTGSISDVFGLTVSSDGKGGKVILKATPTVTVTLVDEEPGVDFTFAYKGSLIVYGQDDKELYTLEIKDETSDSKALGYFGLERLGIFLFPKEEED
jgi:hypothetical protein